MCVEILHYAAEAVVNPEQKIQDELVIAREIVINDAESSIHYKLTKRQTQEEIQTGTIVITREGSVLDLKLEEISGAMYAPCLMMVFNDPTSLTEEDLYDLRNRWATFLDLFNPKVDYDDADEEA
ncbi:hypothetical protein TSUD_296670 [Trifolium subterraneum]|uniref:ATP-dependent RNA helicase PRP5/DDX46/KHDC4 KH domain-containing protein n=1 Tax=Trifolium subterraneum TaxID=3900 RepID=A0A2Z6N082_TRISU|nr:hypothetical protein TSUD_296670 [Trifolium subterraneum]